MKTLDNFQSQKEAVNGMQSPQAHQAPERDPALTAKLLVRLAAGLAAAIGVAVLAGWALELPALKSVLPGAVDMKPNTAVGLVLAGCALYALYGPGSPARRRLAQALALAIAALGMATLGEYAFDWQLGIDELLFRDPGAAYTLARGRMSPYTAAGFLSIAIALAALPRPRLTPVVWAAASMVIVIGVVSVLGYLWNVRELVTDHFGPPLAVHTAAAFIVLGAGVLIGSLIADAQHPGALPALAAVETKVLAVLIGAVAALIIGGGYLYRRTAAFDGTGQALVDATRVELNLRELYAATSDAISAERGYFITGAPDYLEAYYQRSAEARGFLEAVRRLVAASPTQTPAVAELERLTAEAFGQMAKAIALYQRGEVHRAHDLIRSGRNVQTLRDIKATVERMDKAKARILNEKQASVAQSRQETLLLLLVTLAAAVAAVMVLFRGIRSESIARTKAEEALAIEYSAAVHRNVDLKESQEALEHRSREMLWANRFLDSVIENIPHMIFVKDAIALRFVRINRAGEELLGYSKDDLLGKNDYDFFPTEQADFFHSKDRDMLARQAMLDIPAEKIQTRFKGERILHTKKIPIVDEDGRIRYLLGFSEDITEQEEKKAEILRLNAALEQRAIEADSASRAKSTFLATMSHEIRTPMNGMLGTLELLGLTSLDAEQRTTLATVRQASSSLLRIIDDILDFSKIEAGKLEIRPEVCSIKKLIEEVHSIYGGNASSNGVLVRRQVDPRISPAVRVDPLRLRQILNNFVSNALKFTAQGSIEIKAEWIERVNGIERVRFSVKDTGIGISEQDQQRLFEPFTQGAGEAARRAGGTGLGLTICRRLSEMMGGTIEMRSEVGRGTTMSLVLSLPIADPGDLLQVDVGDARDLLTTTRCRTAPSLAQAEEEGTLLLLVDDHPTNRALLLRQVQTLGYAAETVQNGVEALDKWKSGRFGLVVTDCYMPEMDGYELARSIRKIESGNGGKRIPIIACTANAFGGEAETCLVAGMDDYLVKPVELSGLLKKLDRWLPIPAASDATVERGGKKPPPAVDLSVIAATWGGDPSGVGSILAEFRRANDQDANMLRQAVAANDISQAARAAHRMLGASRMVGAEDFAIVCEQLDFASRANDWKTIVESMPAFEDECTRLNGDIESLTSRQQGS